MSFDGRAARLRRELRRSGRIETRMMVFDDPEVDLEMYRLPDWVLDRSTPSRSGDRNQAANPKPGLNGSRG